MNIQSYTHKIATPHIGSFRTAIDIGSKFGEYTINMIDQFKKIECFEPREKKCKNTFWRHIGDKNKKKVNLYHCALGDTNSTVKMNNDKVYESDWWAENGKNANPDYVITVEQKTLDSFAFEDVDFIKIDVEGHELQVLQGAVKTLTTYKPVIVLEQNDLVEEWGKGKKFDAMNFLKTIGYKQVDFDNAMDYVMRHVDQI